MTLSRAAALLVFTAALPACAREPSQPDPPSASAATTTVRLLLDDHELPSIGLTADQPAVELATRLPDGLTMADVLHIYAEAPGGRHLGLRNPSQRYDDPAVRLSLDATGQPTLGLYRQAPSDASAAVQASLKRPVIELAGVHTVTVSVQQPPQTATPTAAEPLLIQASGHGRAAVSPEALAQLPEATDPRGKTGGWQLADLLRARLGDAAVARVQVRPSDRDAAPIDLTGFNDPDVAIIVKHNRQGELRIQRWTRADSNRPDAVYKDIGELMVTLAEAAPR
jgi:hypothetical protein